LPGGTGIFEPTSDPAPSVIGCIPESVSPVDESFVLIPMPLSDDGAELSFASGLLLVELPPLQPAAVRTLMPVTRNADKKKRESFMSHPVCKRWGEPPALP
jgi:hypothetical protein